jgi:3-oxoacyl-(acyl-carrier-protein) synthase
VALVVLERAAAARERGARALGTLRGHASGFEPDPRGAGEGLAACITAALADAGAAPGDVQVVMAGAPPALAALEERALAGLTPARLSPKDVFGETFGAAGPLALLAALAEAPPGATVLVLDVCASGHVAALVVRCGAEQ